MHTGIPSIGFSMAAAPRDGYSIVGANTPRSRPSSLPFAACWAAAGMVAALVTLAAVVTLFTPSSSSLGPSVRLGRWYGSDASHGGNAGRTQALEKTVRTAKRDGGSSMYHPSQAPDNLPLNYNRALSAGAMRAFNTTHSSTPALGLHRPSIVLASIGHTSSAPVGRCARAAGRKEQTQPILG